MVLLLAILLGFSLAFCDSLLVGLCVFYCCWLIYEEACEILDGISLGYIYIYLLLSFK